MNHTVSNERLKPVNYGVGHWKADVRILCEGSANGAGFGLGGVSADGMTRKVTGGPMIPGPDAYLFGIASVIALHGNTGEAIAQAEQDGRLLRVNIGDTLTVDDVTYVIGFADNGRDRHNLTLIVGEAI